MSFFGSSAIHQSVSQTVGHALVQANTLNKQVHRYIHLKESVRNIAEHALYSGLFVSLQPFLKGVIGNADRRLPDAKAFSAQYPAVLQSARDSTAKYLAELSKPRLLRSGFRSSDTIVREKINPLLKQLAQQHTDFVSKVGHRGSDVSKILKTQEDYRSSVRDKIKVALEEETRRQEQPRAGSREPPPRPSANQRDIPRPGQAKTGFGANQRAAPPKAAYQTDLLALTSVWSSDPNRLSSLTHLAGLLEQAAQVNRLTVDQLLRTCVDVKQAALLERPETNKTSMNKIHLALHPDRLGNICLRLEKSPEQIKQLTENSKKFSLFLNWMNEPSQKSRH